MSMDMHACMSVCLLLWAKADFISRDAFCQLFHKCSCCCLEYFRLQSPLVNQLLVYCVFGIKKLISTVGFLTAQIFKIAQPTLFHGMRMKRVHSVK